MNAIDNARAAQIIQSMREAIRGEADGTTFPMPVEDARDLIAEYERVLGSAAAPSGTRVTREYLEGGLGYRIEQDGARFRWVSVEAGEEDVPGDWFLTELGAIRDACTDWRTNGQGDRWAEWSRALAKDAWSS